MVLAPQLPAPRPQGRPAACLVPIQPDGDRPPLFLVHGIGGRVLTFNKEFGNEFIEGRTVEGGGEYIGTNHPLWCAYAEKFGFKKLMIHEEEGLSYPVVVGGKLYLREQDAIWC